eukprot:GGOE01030684.1.p1 GENE.GGOE01030684.1~~GGOE01030684.1.p1  ORF type:complete len:702 (-),score=123.14 GGOE01030684.1:2008-4056(-)
MESVDVIDVTIKSTIKVPIDRIVQTAITPQLLHCRASSTEGDSSASKTTFTLCELFQKAKCERKENCRLVHVEQDFMRGQREKHLGWMQMNAETFGQLPHDKMFEVFNATIKEVMEVPKSQLEYTRGLFLSPEDRDKKLASTISSNAYCGKVPTACLLYLNGSCKWGEHCNQAHISRKWLHGKNRDFQRWMESCKVQFNNLAPTELISAYHPNLYEVIKVPKQYIVQFTRGLYQGGEKVPSVCLLFQKQRCSCEELCKQIHVSSEWLSKQRKSGPQGRRQRRDAPVAVSIPPDPETPKATANISFSSHGTFAGHTSASPTDSPGCSSIASHRSVSPILPESASPHPHPSAPPPAAPIDASDGQKSASATPSKPSASAKPVQGNSTPIATTLLCGFVDSPALQPPVPQQPVPQPTTQFPLPCGTAPISTPSQHPSAGASWSMGFTPVAHEAIGVASPLIVQTPPSSPAVFLSAAMGGSRVGVDPSAGSDTHGTPQGKVHKGVVGSSQASRGPASFDFDSDLFQQLSAALFQAGGQDDTDPMDGPRGQQRRQSADNVAPSQRSSRLAVRGEPQPATQTLEGNLATLRDALWAHSQEVEAMIEHIDGVVSTLRRSKGSASVSDSTNVKVASEVVATALPKVHTARDLLRDATRSAADACQAAVSGPEEFDLAESIMSTCGRPVGM